MATIKDQLEELDSDEFSIRAISVNRGFISVTYESDLENEDVKELVQSELSDEELFAIDFKTNSGPDSNEMLKVIEFRVR